MISFSILENDDESSLGKTLKTTGKVILGITGLAGAGTAGYKIGKLVGVNNTLTNQQKQQQNSNNQISENVANILLPAAGQALVWGGSSALATKLTNKKPKNMSPEQKKKFRKDLAINTLTGAAAGAIGQLI